MTWRLPRFLSAVEQWVFGGLGAEEAETLRAILHAPPVEPSVDKPPRRQQPTGGPRRPSPRRRPMTAAQAKAIQANAAGFDAQMGIG